MIEQLNFAPNLYPLIAENMGEKLLQLKAKAQEESVSAEVEYGED